MTIPLFTDNKPIILILINWYTPAYKAGGPVRSVEGLVHHLNNDYNFIIITGDRDSGESVPLNNIVTDEWQMVGNAYVYYASNMQMKSDSLKLLLKNLEYDLLYINTFFSPRLQ